MLTDLTNVQVKSFQEDYDKNVKIVLLEGAKQDEIVKIAKARGIELKGSRDLAGFKSIYTIADITDANGQVVPKKKLLKVLPTLIGKPINLLHQRKYVTGHYIDYRFSEKDNKVISYGVFYKSNFAEEWETVKAFFDANKLSMSSEIWSPKKSWKYNKDGSFVLGEMELAGGALVYPPDEPAVSGADVLAIAKKTMDANSDVDLLYSTKYSDEEILTCTDGKCELANSARGDGKGTGGKAQGDGGADICVCPKCGKEVKHAKGKPCSEMKCSKCGVVLVGKNKKTNESAQKSAAEEVVETPVEKEVKVEPTIVSKVICANCGEEFAPVPGNNKCKKCFAIIDETGKVMYPPQIINFSLRCLNPICGTSNWLILKQTEKEAHIRCMSCSKEYEIGFAKPVLSEPAKVMDFIYSSIILCPQCNNRAQVSGISSVAKRTITCKECGLQFDIEVGKSKKQTIDSIKEIIVNNKPIENSEGGKEVKKKVEDIKEEKVTESTVEEVVETPAEPIVEEKVEPVVEEVVEPVVEEVVEETTPEVVEETPEVVVEEPVVEPVVEEVVEPVVEEVVETPVDEKVEPVVEEKVETPVEKPVVEEEVVEEPVVEKTDETIVEEVVEEEKPAEEVIETSAEVTPEVTPEVVEEACSEDTVDRVFVKLYRDRVKKFIQLVRDIRKSSQEELDTVLAKVDFYKDNAKTLIDRKVELGTAADKLTDEQIMDDEKYELAKSIKEDADVEKEVEDANENEVRTSIVKGLRESVEGLDKVAKEINDKAFKHVNDKK